MILKDGFKTFSYFLFGLLLFSQVDRLAGQQLPQEMMVINRYANVRKGPGSGYERITTLYEGDRVRAERKYRDWLRVLVSDGQIGWIREDLLGPYKDENRPLEVEEADSLKALIDARDQRITVLEDSARIKLSTIQTQEGLRDSLLGVLGLTEMPAIDKEKIKGQDSVGAARPPSRPLASQESVLGAPESYVPRYEFSPQLGVLIYDRDALAAAGFSVGRNFTREFAYWGDVLFSRRNPPQSGSLTGDINRAFISGGLAYSYKPGNMAVPFAELGTGAAYTQAGDSSSTALDLVFGAGCRLFLIPDLAFKFGYRGHLVLAGNDNQLGQLIYLGGSFNLPRIEELAFAGRKTPLYLAPFAAYQMFSPRFGINGSAVLGVRLGYRLRERLAFEAVTGYLPATVNFDLTERKLGAVEIEGRVLYYPWFGGSGPYILAGGGTLLFTGDGRPPANTKSYGFFQYGGGVNLELNGELSLSSEMTHLLYPNVAELKGRHELASGHALRLTAGLNLSF
ncbi:MAG TPA: SH3 domain-containing protein [archaeon]|nr:SH3 domain-containing protein [archaeon]